MENEPLLELDQVRPKGSLVVTSDDLSVATKTGTAEIDLASIVSYQQNHRTFPLEQFGILTILALGLASLGMMMYFPTHIFTGMILVTGLGLVFATLYYHQDYSRFTEFTVQTESEEFTVYLETEHSEQFDAVLEDQLVSN